jgi:hypothetical protein
LTFTTLCSCFFHEIGAFYPLLSIGQAPNDPAADRPEAADLAWELALPRELAELGMEMARDVRDRTVAEPKPEPAAERKPAPSGVRPAASTGPP